MPPISIFPETLNNDTSSEFALAVAKRVPSGENVTERGMDASVGKA